MGTTKRVETPAFTIEDGTVTRDSGGSRITLKFAAASKRHYDGGIEINNVRAAMYDKNGKFIAKRGHESSRTVIHNRAAWTHEIPTDQLSQAARVVYEVEYKLDIRRKLIGGELVPLAAESDGSDYWLWHRVQVDDKLASYEIAFWARQSELAFTYGHTPKTIIDGLRNEYELDLFDADQNIVMSKNFSCSTSFGRTTFEDNSLYGIDRKTMRTLKFFELRARTELRSVVDLEIANP
ncbi:MAG TPA: hypothetical protein VL326_04205 [Kofleriaceae bacterium]|nr:hypothetical protein [Kofleriaceae bacterium]